MEEEKDNHCNVLGILADVEGWCMSPSQIPMCRCNKYPGPPIEPLRGKINGITKK